jgi:glycosyltransferase involved in cell wall biosynthesis
VKRQNVVIHLSEDRTRAEGLITRAHVCDDFEAFRPQEIAGVAWRAVGSDRPVQRCVICGSPPQEEIGFGLAVAAVAMLRPRSVTVLDVESAKVTRSSLGRFLAMHGHTAALQAALSASSIILQAALALTCRLVPRVRSRGPCASPEQIAYLYPIPGLRSSVGGATTHAHGMIRAFRKAGVRVSAFTTNLAFTDGATPDMSDVGWSGATIPKVVRAVPASAALAGDLALAAKAYSGARSADLIYQRHQRFALVGPLLAMLTRRPLFLEYNGRGNFMVSDPRLFASQRELCEQAALHAAARVVVVSEVERRRLVGRGFDPQRIIVAPNGVEPMRFANGGGEPIRRHLGLGNSDQVIGFVGTFGPWHGAKVLAQAFPLVAAQAPKAHLLLVGDGQERSAVEQILAGHNLSRRAIFMGKVPSPQVPALLDACDILASPHVPLPNGEEFFGSPTKLFEYMAAAKPIVASRLGQIGDVLLDGETALLVTPGSVEELARGILRLLGDAQLRQRLGRAAREAAVAHHSWDHNVAAIARAYRELASTGTTR